MEHFLDENDFYHWAYWNLVVNTQRGHLAEFIVAKALGIESERRCEWASYDLQYGDSKIEIKSGAYIQSWPQKQFSKITFAIAPTKFWDSTTGLYAESKERHADIYVFCLLKHKERESINPLDLTQWAFYIVSTNFLNIHFGNQRSITLSTLERHHIKPVQYKEIKSMIDSMMHATHTHKG